GGAHHAGIRVRQQPRVERDPTGFGDVLDGRREPALGEERAVAGERDLGLVAEAHQRLDAVQVARALGPGADLLGLHRPGAVLALVAPERAVRAAVAAQVGDREERLAREGDRPSLAGVAQVARARTQLVERVAARIERGDRGGAVQRTPLAGRADVALVQSLGAHWPPSPDASTAALPGELRGP